LDDKVARDFYANRVVWQCKPITFQHSSENSSNLSLTRLLENLSKKLHKLACAGCVKAVMVVIV